MRGVKGLTVLAALGLFGVAYAQSGAAPFQNDLIAYAAFQSDVSDLAAMQISSAADLDAALDSVGRHDRNAFVRGWMAYGADVAAQSPAFVNGVREAANQIGREVLVHDIASDRAYARRLPGGEEATALVAQMMAADSARVANVGDRYQEYSASLQRQTWASAAAQDQDARVQHVRDLARPGGYAPSISISMGAQLAVTPLSVQIGADSAGFGGARFWDAAHGAPAVVQVAARAPARWRVSDAGAATLDGVVSLAALQVLGAAPVEAGAYLNDASSLACVEMAQLQFYQCLSTARYGYESAYCMAQHGLRDVAACMSAAVAPDGDVIPASAPAPPTLVAAPTPAPVAATPLSAPAAQSAPATDFASFLASLGTLGPGELFARADELDQQGAANEARAVRRALVARFPDSPLAALAAQQLAAHPAGAAPTTP